MATVVNLKRAVLPRSDDPGRIAAELRTGIAAHRAEAERLADQWLRAATQAEAERFDRTRCEALRLAARDEGKIAELEHRLAAAKAERQRAAIAKHQTTLRRLFPKLRAALDAAASVQSECIAARDTAIAELGENVTELNLPRLVYGGLLFADLIAAWGRDMERLVDGMTVPSKLVPAASRPAAPAKAALAAVAPAPTSVPAPFAPRPRPLRNDPMPEPGSGLLLIEFVRPGAEVDGGLSVRAGDRIALPAAEAANFLRAGAATEPGR
jgi:hypothetical protein